MVRACMPAGEGALRAWGIKLLDPPFDIFLRFELFVKHIFYSLEQPKVDSEQNKSGPHDNAVPIITPRSAHSHFKKGR